MEKANAFVVLVEKAHPVVVNVVLLAVGLVILIWVISSIAVLKKNITVHATADRLLTLQVEYNELNKNTNILQGKYNRSLAIQTNIKNIYAELKYLFYLFADGEDIQSQAYSILKLITDRIATDLKFSGGQIHRCGLWLSDGEYLRLYVASMSLRNISFYFRESFITKAFSLKNVVLNNIFAKAESIKKFLLLPVHLRQHYHLGRF